MNLILGTAMWGWTTPKEVCFQLLDSFYEKGFREVDSATNYPINKTPKDFRKAELILEEWIKVHGVSDLKVMMKIGSLNNMRTPDHNLSKSFLLMNLDDYKYRFENNLNTIMIHWDNRTEREKINETFEAFQIIHNQGFRLGLSGIKSPTIYYGINKDYGFDFRIQMKHNLLFSDYEKYQLFHGKKRFIPYGINAGGLKLNLENYDPNSSLKARGGEVGKIHPISKKLNKLISKFNSNSSHPKITSFNQIAMIFALNSPDIDSILIGPSKISQLLSSISFFESWKENQYLDMYNLLISLNNE